MQGKLTPNGSSIIKKPLNEVKRVKVSEEEKDKIMEDWGFKNKDAAEALAFKIQKERMRKAKKGQKQLTATEKYEKFLKVNKKL
jgi:hypothetical protein